MNGAKYPLIWPATLPEEDSVRERGHMVLTRGRTAQLTMLYLRGGGDVGYLGSGSTAGGGGWQ